MDLNSQAESMRKSASLKNTFRIYGFYKSSWILYKLYLNYIIVNHMLMI